MKLHIKMMLALILLLLSCRERVSQLDIMSDDFVSPPPTDAEVTGLYYQAGNLVGIQFTMLFAEASQGNVDVTNVFFQDISERLRTVTTIHTGDQHYVIEIFGPYELGDYSLRQFFGEIAIGARIFSIVQEKGQMVIHSVPEVRRVLDKAQEWRVVISP